MSRSTPGLLRSERRADFNSLDDEPEPARVVAEQPARAH